MEIGHLQLVAACLPARLGKYARNKSISAEALATMELIELSGKDPLGRIYSRYANRFNWQQGKTAVRTYQMAVRLAELDQGVAIVDSASANFFSDKLRGPAAGAARRVPGLRDVPQGGGRHRHHACAHAVRER